MAKEGWLNDYIRIKTAERLRAGVALVREHADRFDMMVWLENPKNRLSRDTVGELCIFGNDCGTTMCLAAFVLMAAPAEFREASGRKVMSIMNGAAEYLDIEGWRAADLFLHSRWPPRFFTAYNDASASPKRRVDVLAARVEYFIEYGC